MDVNEDMNDGNDDVETVVNRVVCEEREEMALVNKFVDDDVCDSYAAVDIEDNDIDVSELHPLVHGQDMRVEKTHENGFDST